MAAAFEELFVGDGSEDENDDTISLTSTVESVHDEDKEFVVDAILAERPNKNATHEGDMEYLIKWENYPLDQCTWEAVGNLSEDLQEQWREQREQELSGQRSPFSLQIYEEAIAEAVRSRAARHNRRNAKRQRLNLPLTEPLPVDYLDASSASIASKEDSESDDYAMGIDESEPDQPMPTAMPTPKVIKQTTFKGIPPSKPSPPQTEPGPSKVPESRPGTTVSSSKLPAEPTGKTPPTRIWQGTARKPSGSDKSATKPTTVVPKPQSMTSSTSLKNKFGKSLKATRTQVPKPLLPRSTSASGSTLVPKPRKRRANLKDAMMDPTKPRKLMTNLHRVNQLKKKADELNDTAPSDPSLIPAAFFITDAQPRRTQSNEQPRKDRNGSNDNAAQASPARTTSNGPKKDRKSVRFVEDRVGLLFEEPMDIDDPEILTDPTNSRTHSGATPRKLSLTTYQERSTTQAIAKSASFGSEGSREVPVMFNGITRSNDGWVRRFLSEQVLNFRTICTSEDFFSGDCLYKPESRLSSGKLESTTDQAALVAVAANLRRASSGFYLALVDYSVLVYPGQCAAWERLIDPASPSEVALRHLIFRTTPTLTLSHYPPLSVAMTGQTHDSPSSALIRVRLMREISTMDYKVLQPPAGTRSGKKPAFFLLFHQSEDFLFRMLSLWLRACQSDCLIFYNLQEGSWKRFLEATTAGAVILHESVEKSIRKIPRLWDVLKYGQHNFWSLSSSDHETKLRPIVAEETRDSQNIQRLPPQLKMTRLFPHGRAFLITPSFAISEPAKLCRFLQFFQGRSSFAPCVLVACANFPQYLLELATEKAHESDTFSRKNSRDSYIDKMASLEGISRHDTHNRLQAWGLMKGIVEKYEHTFAADEPGEDIRKTVWIDELISPDDEQSLLNWFAAWSTTRLNTYRKFYVLGSSPSGIKKARRKVRVPNYTLETINNLEAAFGRIAAIQKTSGDSPMMSESRSSENAAMVSGGQTLPRPAPYAFRSEIFKSDRASELRSWIMHIMFTLGKSWTRVYDNPVSWLDIKMADHFKDPRSEYATYTNWFNSPPKFSQRVNTLIGLFYTVETDWNEHDKALPAARHPWIAIFRPVDPHLNQDNYTKMELLIWDCAAGQRWPVQPDRAQSIQSNELLPMQRRLIDFVHEQAPKRFAEYFLERVFIGGWNIPPRLQAPWPIDVTCGVVKELITNTRDILPPWDKLLLDHGWRKVKNGQQESSAPSTNWAGTDPSQPVPPSATKKGEIPKCILDLEEPERIIFHPPRSDFPLHSICANDLYSAALQARKKDPDCMTFEYRYRTTMDWYHELQKENRAYNHMNVDAWEMIFDDLRITR